MVELRLALETRIRTLRNDLAKRMHLNPYMVVSAQEILAIVDIAVVPSTAGNADSYADVSPTYIMEKLRWLPWKSAIAEEIAGLISAAVAPAAECAASSSGTGSSLSRVVADSTSHKERKSPPHLFTAKEITRQSSLKIYRPDYSSTVTEGPAAPTESSTESVTTEVVVDLPKTDETNESSASCDAAPSEKAVKASFKRPLMGGLGGLALKKRSF